MENWRVELVKGNAGELHVPEPTVIEWVIKCWRAELSGGCTAELRSRVICARTGIFLSLFYIFYAY